MAFLVTSFNAWDDSKSCGCCEPIRRKASATCEAVRVEVEPNSMAYSFSVSRSLPVLPVKDDSIDMLFSKFMASATLSLANLNAAPTPATAAPTPVKVDALMPNFAASPSTKPPRLPPCLVVPCSSFWNPSSSLFAFFTRLFRSSNDLLSAFPNGDCFSLSDSREYCAESSTKAFDSSLIFPLVVRLTVSILPRSRAICTVLLSAVANDLPVPFSVFSRFNSSWDARFTFESNCVDSTFNLVITSAIYQFISFAIA